VAMEYRLSPTSNQYVKMFYNQNAYDWLEGYTSEYGGGFIWRRKLSHWWEVFSLKTKTEQPMMRQNRMTSPRENGLTSPRDSIAPRDSSLTAPRDTTKTLHNDTIR